jgi:uncharacterized protein YbjT (DUF2867 family)
MNILILGATGLVGRNALAQALVRPSVTQVIAPTRKPLSRQDQLVNPVAPKLELLLPDVASWEPDAAICATGTTIKKAESKEAFRSIDHDLPLFIARRAHQAGTQIFALVSAMGASVDSPLLYTKVKGELERDVREIGFRSLTILRPSMIEGERDEVRLAESLVLKLSHFLAARPSKTIPCQSCSEKCPNGNRCSPNCGCGLPHQILRQPLLTGGSNRGRKSVAFQIRAQ